MGGEQGFPQPSSTTRVLGGRATALEALGSQPSFGSRVTLRTVSVSVIYIVLSGVGLNATGLDPGF